MDQRKKELIKKFTEYINSTYDMTAPLVRNKYAHTLCVARAAERIAEYQGLPEPLVHLAWLAGLFHDFGRFPQVTKFATFNDAQSLSHAEVSVSMLFDNNLIRDFLTEEELPTGSLEYEELKDAIWQHSRMALSENSKLRAMSSREDYLWLHKLLHDADKIDIIRAYYIETDTCTLHRKPVDGDHFDPTIFQSFVEQKFVNYATIKHAADEYVACAAYCYSLYYPESRRVMLEQKFIYRMMNKCPLVASLCDEHAVLKQTLMLFLKQMAENL